MLLVVTLGGVGYLAPQIFTNVQTIMATKQEIVNKTTTLQEKTSKIR